MTKISREHFKYYVFQFILSIITFYIILLILMFEHAVIIASLGASTFIVFAMPRNITARSRNIIGGHLIGFLSGTICSLIPCPNIFVKVATYSLAVGLSILLMILTDTGHPPASGTALGVVIHKPSIQIFVAVVVGSVFLSFIKYLFEPYLRNLYQ